MIIVKQKKPYKVIVKFSPKSISYYYQQLLINYPHWNEEKFFANPITKIKSPLIFKVDNVKLAVMAGFEIHFDEILNLIESSSV